MLSSVPSDLAKFASAAAPAPETGVQSLPGVRARAAAPSPAPQLSMQSLPLVAEKQAFTRGSPQPLPMVGSQVSTPLSTLLTASGTPMQSLAEADTSQASTPFLPAPSPGLGTPSPFSPPKAGAQSPSSSGVKSLTMEANQPSTEEQSSPKLSVPAPALPATMTVPVPLTASPVASASAASSPRSPAGTDEHEKILFDPLRIYSKNEMPFISSKNAMQFLRSAAITFAADHPNIQKSFAMDFPSSEGCSGIVDKHNCVSPTLRIESPAPSSTVLDPSKTESVTMDLLMGLASGVAYLHTNHIAHTSLSPSAIFMAGNSPVITRFGWSCVVLPWRGFLRAERAFDRNYEFTLPDPPAMRISRAMISDMYSLAMIFLAVAMKTNTPRRNVMAIIAEATGKTYGDFWGTGKEGVTDGPGKTEAMINWFTTEGNDDLKMQVSRAIANESGEAQSAQERQRTLFAVAEAMKILSTMPAVGSDEVVDYAATYTAANCVQSLAGRFSTQPPPEPYLSMEENASKVISGGQLPIQKLNQKRVNVIRAVRRSATTYDAKTFALGLVAAVHAVDALVSVTTAKGTSPHPSYHRGLDRWYSAWDEGVFSSWVGFFIAVFDSQRNSPHAPLDINPFALSSGMRALGTEPLRGSLLGMPLLLIRTFTYLHDDMMNQLMDAVIWSIPGNVLGTINDETSTSFTPPGTASVSPAAPGASPAAPGASPVVPEAVPTASEASQVSSDANPGLLERMFGGGL